MRQEGRGIGLLDKPWPMNFKKRMDTVEANEGYPEDLGIMEYALYYQTWAKDKILTNNLRKSWLSVMDKIGERVPIEIRFKW